MDATNKAAAQSVPTTNSNGKLFPRADDLSPYVRAGHQLIPLHKWDAVDSKGRPRGKTPRDGKWQANEYDSNAVVERVRKHGINAGVRLSASVMVLDVDPRNFGGQDDPENLSNVDRLAELVRDTHLDLSLAPHTITGSGGHHYWFKKPADISLMDSLQDYPGIEFKSFGRQVVATGSVHPGGQKVVDPNKADFYRWDDLAPDLEDMPEIPMTLLNLIRRPTRTHGEAAGGGELTSEMLAKTLEQIDPSDYADQSTWLNIMMASHHATHGEGRQEFIDWSTRDPEYADHEWVIGRRWDSLHLETGRGGRPVTIKFLHKIIQEAGFEVAKPDPADDFEIWSGEAVEQSSTKRFKIFDAKELCSIPPPKWLIPGLLTESSLAAIYGPPGSGKSFLAVDMAMAVSSSLSWHGREVLAGNVLYIAAEGAPGVNTRVTAWREQNSVKLHQLKFFLMRDSINFASEKSTDVTLLIKEITDKCGPLKLVIIDTLNQTAAGADENSAKDMSLYINSMKRLRDETGATVVVVHHSGKDSSKGMRGSSALLGAMDTTIEVDSAKDFKLITVSVRKQKDAEKEMPIRFNLESVGKSLVLSAALMTDIEDDFLPNENPFLTEICEMVRKAGGQITVKEVVDNLTSKGGSGERTVRRKLLDVIFEGQDRAVTVSGLKMWLKRIGENPRGPLDIISEEIQRLS